MPRRRAHVSRQTLRTVVTAKKKIGKSRNLENPTVSRLTEDQGSRLFFAQRNSICSFVLQVRIIGGTKVPKLVVLKTLFQRKSYFLLNAIRFVRFCNKVVGGSHGTPTATDYNRN
jgi:hypothetical protein